MAAGPAISVITAAWNVEAYVAETIRSVQAQSFADWEHIVVDDGSTDGTAAAAEAAGDHRMRIIRQENGGQSSARNAGLAIARGRRIIMLDADDILRPDALTRLSAALDAAPEAVFAFGHVWLIDAAGRSFGDRRAFAAQPVGDRLPALLERCLIATVGCVLMPIEAFHRAGGYDDAIRKAQDWEFWVRLATLGPVAELGGEAVIEYRLRPGSISRLKVADPAETRPALDKIFSNPEVQARFTAAALRRARRRAEGEVAQAAGSELLRLGQFGLARMRLLQALRLDARGWKRWALLICAVLRWVPRPIARRIGFEG